MREKVERRFPGATVLCVCQWHNHKSPNTRPNSAENSISKKQEYQKMQGGTNMQSGQDSPLNSDSRRRLPEVLSCDARWLKDLVSSSP
mmetsp:Transcript_54592/g.119490  ORF Transcript_54592/g.119490 Transcript_54592/m.119490 type:complete len:88 (+) Transcript_54592:51-314(+)